MGGLFLCLSVAATLFEIVTVIGCSSVLFFVFLLLLLLVLCSVQFQKQASHV